jgi:hypothetical protein
MHENVRDGMPFAGLWTNRLYSYFAFITPILTNNNKNHYRFFHVSGMKCKHEYEIKLTSLKFWPWKLKNDVICCYWFYFSYLLHKAEVKWILYCLTFRRQIYLPNIYLDGISSCVLARTVKLLPTKHTQTSISHARPFASTFQRPVCGLVGN